MLGGIALMALVVGVALLVLAREAGGWGVPYFSFTSAHGSPCRNDLVGYTCTSLTLDDVEFFGDVDLPAGTRVVTSRYHATHDYDLRARLEVPSTAAATALKRVRSAYGHCRADARPPAPTTGLTGVCVILTGDGSDESGELPSRIVNVATGLRPDGVRVVDLAIRSR